MNLLYPGFPGGRIALRLLAVRLVAGTAFVYHGWPKLQHGPLEWMGRNSEVPGILQAAAVFSEVVGGVAWILGALTPLFSLLLAGTMAYATFLVHIRAGHPFVSTEGPSFELALVYLSVAVLLLLAGPGALSVDWCLFGRGDQERGGRPAT